jgi:hypothetical protein
VSNEPGIGENGLVSREFGCSEVEHRERAELEVCARVQGCKEWRREEGIDKYLVRRESVE